MKAGIIGCGFIGQEIANFIENSEEFELVAVNDIDEEKIKNITAKYKKNKIEFMDLDSMIQKCDLIIESAAKPVVEKILKSKNLDVKNKKLLIMSTGGLINNIESLNKIKNCEILLPSGAISGLDSIKAVSGKIKSLTLTTTKSSKSLGGAPFLVKNKIDLEKLEDKKTIFEGNIKDAIEGFPQNINVAATLSLASKFDGIKIKIVADPNTKFNTHEIEAKGDFGIIKTTTQNLPSKNPKTSYLAVLSAISVLKSIKNNVNIGN